MSRNDILKYRPDRALKKMEEVPHFNEQFPLWLFKR